MKSDEDERIDNYVQVEIGYFPKTFTMKYSIFGFTRHNVGLIVKLQIKSNTAIKIQYFCFNTAGLKLKRLTTATT